MESFKAFINSLQHELCDRCEFIFTAAAVEEIDYSPHHNIIDLQASGSAGCSLCKLFYNQLSDEAVLELQNQNPPLAGTVFGPRRFAVPHPLAVLNIGLHYTVQEHMTYECNVAILEDKQGLASEEYTHIVEESTDCPSSWDISKHWIKCCTESHTSCMNDIKPVGWLPTRLIDLGAEESHNNVRLCLSRNLDASIKYVTLSHCWGNLEFTKLLGKNEKDMQKCVPVQELSKTFRDALSVTQHLGFRYIWIDSLCIVQDNEDDWRWESALMGAVYGFSTLTIAAAGARDGSEGLFFKRPPALIEKLGLPFLFKNGGVRYVSACVDLHIYDRCIGWGPLVTRAWVYQEQYLSRRTLYFGKSQLFWYCRENCACETFPDGLPRNLNTKEQNHFSHAYMREGIQATFPQYRNPKQSNHSIRNLRQTGLLIEWHEIVREYSKRNLTKGKDKLVALSGVARSLHNRFGYEYIAGLWRPELEWQLMWAISDLGIRGSQRSASDQIPSWSWASVDGEIDLGSDKDDFHYQTCVTVLGTCIIPTAEDLFGEIKDGQLRIEGRKMTCGRYTGWGSLSIIAGWDWVEIKCSVDIDTLSALPRTLYCLIIYESSPAMQGLVLQGLILEACDNRPGHFCRLGVFSITPEASKSFKSTAGAPVVDGQQTDFGDFATVDKHGNHRHIITLV